MKKFIVMLIMLIITFTVFSVNAQSEEVIMELFCNDTICEDGRFYGGNLTLNGRVKTKLSNGEAIAIVAQYDSNGALLDVALSKKIIEQPDDEITVSLSSVEETGIVKCMVFDAQTLEPICPAQVYASYDDNVTIWADMLDTYSSAISSTSRTAVKYYAAPEAANTIRLYVEKKPKVTVNGIEIAFSNTFDLVKYNDYIAKIYFSETTGDSYYDNIDITVYEHKIVSQVLTDKSKIIFQDGSVLTFDFDNLLKEINFYDNIGNQISFESIKKDDILAMEVKELNSDFTPVKAQNTSGNISIYVLNGNYISGKLVGIDNYDDMLYINDIPYHFNNNFITSSQFNDLELGCEGDFYISINNSIIGYKGLAQNSNYAFILQGAESSSTWDRCYQVKLLLSDGSIGTYDIDNEVIVSVGNDEYEYVYQDGDQRIFAVAEWWKGTNDAYKRVIDFKTDKTGTINKIKYIYLNSDDTSNFVELDGTSSYNQNNSAIDGNVISSNAIIFNIDVTDSDDATVLGADNLMDECTYSGYLLNKQYGEYNIFLMTSGASQISQKEPLKVVDKVIKYLYNDENVLRVFYYTQGDNERKSVMFSADSEKYDAKSLSYSTLDKGSIFVCKTNKDNIADYYMVLANVDNSDANYNMTGFADRFAAMYDNANISYVYGIISKISYNNENVIITINGSDYIIDGATYQYYYNSEGSKKVINIGDIIGSNVDNEDTDGGNYVFLKLYGNKVTEAITFSERVKAN